MKYAKFLYVRNEKASMQKQEEFKAVRIQSENLMTRLEVSQQQAQIAILSSSFQKHGNGNLEAFDRCHFSSQGYFLVCFLRY
jgi:hypothetical protein